MAHRGPGLEMMHGALSKRSPLPGAVNRARGRPSRKNSPFASLSTPDCVMASREPLWASMWRISGRVKYQLILRTAISRLQKLQTCLACHRINNNIDFLNIGLSRNPTSKREAWVYPCRSTSSAFTIPMIVLLKSRLIPNWPTMRRAGSSGNSSRDRSIWWQSARNALAINQ